MTDIPAKSGTVFITRAIPEMGLRLLKKSAKVKLWKGTDYASPPREYIINGIKKADVLYCLLTEKIDEEILSANPRLMGIANMAVGYDNIDIDTATRLGIPVSNTPGILTDTTADLTWALILSLTRRIVEADRYVREDKFKSWDPTLFMGRDISPGGSNSPKTLGIIGFGRIGQAVAQRARGFSMHIIVYDPMNKSLIDSTSRLKYRKLDTLLRTSDVVTLHVPLNEDTYHMIDKEKIALMKSSAYIINTSRGKVIDEKSLYNALKENRIAGAGLDVYEDEPCLYPGLTELPNVVLLPHIGSSSIDTRNEMSRLAAENALAFIQRKKAPNTVNPEVYQTDAYKERISR